MGVFSFIKDASESARRQIYEEKQQDLEAMEDSIKYMRIAELGQFYTTKFRSGMSLHSKSKVITLTVERLKNYSLSEKENFIKDYQSYYSSLININFVNLVKKSMN